MYPNHPTKPTQIPQILTLLVRTKALPTLTKHSSDYVQKYGLHSLSPSRWRPIPLCNPRAYGGRGDRGPHHGCSHQNHQGGATGEHRGQRRRLLSTDALVSSMRRGLAESPNRLRIRDGLLQQYVIRYFSIPQRCLGS